MRDVERIQEMRAQATYVAEAHSNYWAEQCVYLLDEIELLHGIVKELAIGHTEPDDTGVRRSS